MHFTASESFSSAGSCRQPWRLAFALLPPYPHAIQSLYFLNSLRLSEPVNNRHTYKNNTGCYLSSFGISRRRAIAAEILMLIDGIYSGYNLE